MTTKFIAIDGMPCSGKTKFLEKLKKKFERNLDVFVVPNDYFNVSGTFDDEGNSISTENYKKGLFSLIDSDPHKYAFSKQLNVYVTKYRYLKNLSQDYKVIIYEQSFELEKLITKILKEFGYISDEDYILYLNVIRSLNVEDMKEIIKVFIKSNDKEVKEEMLTKKFDENYFWALHEEVGIMMAYAEENTNLKNFKLINIPIEVEDINQEYITEEILEKIRDCVKKLHFSTIIDIALDSGFLYLVNKINEML